MLKVIKAWDIKDKAETSVPSKVVLNAVPTVWLLVCGIAAAVSWQHLSCRILHQRIYFFLAKSEFFAGSQRQVSCSTGCSIFIQISFFIITLTFLGEMIAHFFLLHHVCCRVFKRVVSCSTLITVCLSWCVSLLSPWNVTELEFFLVPQEPLSSWSNISLLCS